MACALLGSDLGTQDFTEAFVGGHDRKADARRGLEIIQYQEIALAGTT